jgi:predicted deacylase
MVSATITVLRLVVRTASAKLLLETSAPRGTILLVGAASCRAEIDQQRYHNDDLSMNVMYWLISEMSNAVVKALTFLSRTFVLMVSKVS